MAKRLEGVAGEFEKLGEEAIAKFGRLTGEQLNWKPAAKSWSIAQCFDHLITINSLYFPIFEKFKAGSAVNTFWERNSPFSVFFGRYLIKVLSPDYGKKMKTSKKAFPSASKIDGGILVRFGYHQKQLAGRVRSISSRVDLKTVITSPLAAFVTYSLDDCLTILTVHEKRHFDQARRVADSEDFPI